MADIKAEGLDYLGIFRELNRKKIRYIVCGGVALNLLGIPRMTYDIDLLLKMEPSNLDTFLQVVKSWGFRPRVPVDIMGLLSDDKRRERIEKKNMKAFGIYNPRWAISEIDVLIDVAVDYETAIHRVLNKKVGGVKVPVIFPQDLIEMKRNTNRKQDEADIRYLKGLIRDGKDRI